MRHWAIVGGPKESDKGELKYEFPSGRPLIFPNRAAAKRYVLSHGNWNRIQRVEIKKYWKGGMMEPSKHAPNILHVFECLGSGKHRLIRKAKINNSECGRCETPRTFRLIAEVKQSDGETDIDHFYRAASAKEQKA